MNFESMSEKEVSDIANPIMDDLMDASSHIDHEKNIQDFTDRLKSVVAEEHLQGVCEKYQKEKGIFVERTLLSVLRNQSLIYMKIYFLLFFSANVFSKDVKLTYWDEVYTLYSIHQDDPEGAFFGVYRHAMDLTGGTVLYLFPDYKFVITKFCDICEEKTIGYGTFNLEDSKVVFKYKLEPKMSFESLHVRQGFIQKDNNEKNNIKFLFTSEQLEKIELNHESYDYMSRFIQYYNWIGIKNKLLQKNH